MRIGILGAGAMAAALGGKWVAAGHRVVVGGRDRAGADALAARIGARGGGLVDAAAFGEVVLLAAPAVAVPAVLTVVGAGSGGLAGRIVVDCTNPVDEADRFRLRTADGPAMAVQVAAAATGAEVSKAFNLGSAALWAGGPRRPDGRPLLAPVAAATDRAAERTAQLVADVGAVAVRWGGLDRAGQLEAVAAFGIRLIADGLAFDAMMPTRQPGPAPGTRPPQIRDAGPGRVG